MVVIAVLAIVVLIAAPSFRELILMQRLRGINGQLVTDLQAARAAAAARGTVVHVRFGSNAGLSCYSLSTSDTNTSSCDCTLGPGSACTGTMVELRTVQIPRSLGITVAPQSGFPAAFGFDPVNGGLYFPPSDARGTPAETVAIESFIDSSRMLRTMVHRAGRPLVCTPAGSRMTEAACP